jgi:hypothetical protein
VGWICVLISVLSDVFRRRDVSGWSKAAWVMFVIILPFLGVLIYLAVNSNDMADRKIQEATAFAATYGGGGPTAEIEQAKALLDNGTITEVEFTALKAKALA